MVLNLIKQKWENVENVYMKITRTLDTYLPPDPKRNSTAGDRFVIGIGFLAVIGCIILIGATLLRDSRMTAKVAIQPDQWKVAYQSGIDSGCSREVEVTNSCPASPKNETLWKSSMSRGSPEFLKTFEERPDSLYWMGVVIPAAKLREAAHKSAPVLILPATHGSTSVWIDGVFRLSHRFQDQGLPPQITLPRHRLLEGRDLYVAILVSPYPNYSAPEARKASMSEGFFTSIEADHLMRWTVFDGLTRNLIFSGLLLLLAGILWAASVDNRIAYDYVVGRQFALVLALISLLSMDISTRQLTVPAAYRLNFLMLLLEAFFVLRMTASILRLTRSTSWTLAAGLVTAGVLVFFLTPWLWIEAKGLKLLTSVALPLIYGASAILIGHRAISIYRNRGDASIDRVQFLFISAGVFFATAIAYFAESSLNHALEVKWSRALNIVIIYSLVRLYIRSRRRKITFIDSLPVSRHHINKKDGSELRGWIIEVRLSSPRKWINSNKNPQIDSGTIKAVLSHLWTIIQLHGGEIVKHDGHSFHAFFEHKADGSDPTRVSNALDDLEAALRVLNSQLKIEAPEGSFHPTIHFRASVVKGSAQPIWANEGRDRKPAWTVRASATLKGTHDEPGDRSIVIMSEADAGQFPLLPKHVPVQKVSVKPAETVA